MAIFSTAAGTLIGPIVGLLGGAFNNWLALKNKHLDMEDRKAARTHDLLVLRLKGRQALESEMRALEHLDKKVAAENESRKYEADAGVDQQVAKNVGEMMRNISFIGEPTESDSWGERWFKLIVTGSRTALRVIVTLMAAVTMFGLAWWSFWTMSQADDIPWSTFDWEWIISFVIYSTVEISATVITFWFSGRTSSLRSSAFQSWFRKSATSVEKDSALVGSGGGSYGEAVYDNPFKKDPK